MSQIHVPSANEPPPPEVPLKFTVDIGGPSVPVANNENIFARDSISNNINGIRTNNDVSGSETIYVELTNRITAVTTTTNAIMQSTTIFPFNTNAGPGTYFFDFHTVAYNQTDALSAGYQTQFCVRWNGALGTLVTPYDYVTCEEGTMIGCDITFVSTGVANLTIQITGLAAKTISWQITGTYYYVG